jgi:hypothetical protein
MAQASRWLPVFQKFVSDVRIKSKEKRSEDDRGVPFVMWESQRRYLKQLADGLDDGIRIHYWLKARQLGCCLDPETKVLTADLRWVRIASLQTGDEVIAVDEHPLVKGKGGARRMRTARIQGVIQVFHPAYRITFDDGRSIICTAQHPWLSKQKSAIGLRWRSLKPTKTHVGKLRVGDQVRWITKPWGEPTFDDGWFGGILDGEGSLAGESRAGASVCAAQRPGAVWDRMVSYASERGYSSRVESDKAYRLNSERPLFRS